MSVPVRGCQLPHIRALRRCIAQQTQSVEVSPTLEPTAAGHLESEVEKRVLRCVCVCVCGSVYVGERERR